MNKELHKELEEISSVLANIPKEDISAPEGYFDNFSSRMLDRVKSEGLNAPKTKVISIYKKVDIDITQQNHYQRKNQTESFDKRSKPFCN